MVSIIIAQRAVPGNLCRQIGGRLARTIINNIATKREGAGNWYTVWCTVILSNIQ